MFLNEADLSARERKSDFKDAGAHPAGESQLLPIAVLVFWIVSISIVSAHHVVWRDEVRTLSVATLGSFRAMLANSRYDGHPLLWYVMLRAAWFIYSGPIVLKIVSVAVGFAAVSLFLVRAPFPFWVRCLVVFGLPFYDYSVVARDYGIAMLLMFLFADLSTRHPPRPILAGFVLFLLANTNAHSVILAGLLLGIWCFQLVASRSTGENDNRYVRIAGILLAAAGIILSVATLGRSGGSNQSAPPRALNVIRALPSVLLNPGASFTALTAMEQAAPRAVSILGWTPQAAEAAGGVVSTLIILFAITGLAGRPLLAAAAVAAVWSLAAFFEFVYPGYYRHEGLLVAFILTLYWIALRQPPARMPIFFLTLVPLLIPLVLHAVAKDVSQFMQPASSSRDLALLLNSRPDLRRATLAAVPDFMLESMPYYAQNQLYFLCPIPAAPFVSVAPGPKCQLNLEDVVARLGGLHAATGRPVVLLLAPRLERAEGEAEENLYHFTWNPAGVAALHERTERISSFRKAATDENYEVYLIR